MENHRLDDKDFLALLQILIKNGNLMQLVSQFSNFHEYRDVEKGISWLLSAGIIRETQEGYEITPSGVAWRASAWRKLGIKGIYRYISPSHQAKGIKKAGDDTFLPKRFNYTKES